MPQPVHLHTNPNTDWFTLDVSNGIVSFSVLPGTGGRVMDFSLGKTRVFYTNPRLRGKAVGVDPGLGTNYGGSKVWPGPQGWTSETEWPGPPDPFFDLGAYDWKAELTPAFATVHLSSAHDEYTGTTVQREIKTIAGSSSVEVRHSMRNSSRRPVRWSIWQVTQVDAIQGLEIFCPATGFHQTFGDKIYPAAHFNAAQKRVHIRYEDQVAKLAVEANQGWFASLDRARKLVLAETFPVTSGASYPDNAPVAFWIAGHGTFTLHGDQVDMGTAPGGCDPHVETEIMSPLTDLQPGESVSLRTAWHVAAFDAPEIISVNSCGAIGIPLAVETGPRARFTGYFGVFWEAKLELIAYDRASQIVAAVELEDVSPSQPLVLNREVALPSHTVRCSLVLFDHDHKQLGVLDRVNLR